MKKLTTIFVFILFMVASFFIYKNYEEAMEKEKQKAFDDTINNIKEHYNSYVKTNKDSKIYEYVNDEYKEIGIVKQNVELRLSEIIIDENTKYFHLKELDYYIDYLDVTPIENMKESYNHYKNYVVFNENIITKETTSFYDEAGLLYTINKSFSLPIIIKEDDSYYGEYLNKLVYVKKEDVEKVLETSNTVQKTRNNIRTLAYHFVYKEGEECTNSYICHSEEQFISHMKYINENDYFSLTMNDLKLFLQGKIQIPEKSIVITLDDGYLAKNAIEIMEQNEVYGTYFVVTSWIKAENLVSKYVELHSHTDNMHNNYRCPGGNQGGQILCEDRNKITEDLNTSREKLNNSIAFAYPFYDYNDYIINILKEVGFELAFIGVHNTMGMADQNTDLFKIPRLTISSLTTMDEFISYLK